MDTGFKHARVLTLFQAPIRFLAHRRDLARNDCRSLEQPSRRFCGRSSIGTERFRFCLFGVLVQDDSQRIRMTLSCLSVGDIEIWYFRLLPTENSIALKNRDRTRDRREIPRSRESTCRSTEGCEGNAASTSRSRSRGSPSL